MRQFQAESTWFLAQFKPNCHRIAKRNLERQNFQIFLPLHEETRRKAGRFISALRPLFPGYLFVAFDTSKGGWHAINSTYGVTKLVSFGQEPRPVPSGLISRLMLRCNAEDKLLPPQIFRAGDTVKISAGPFARLVATIEEIAPNQRVWVLLDLMGRTTRMAVPAEALEAV